MFKVDEYPPMATQAFHNAPVIWLTSFYHAMNGGVKDINKLTDLIFFMHHPERMLNGIGNPLNLSEKHFTKLVSEWNLWSIILKPLLKDGSSIHSDKSDDVKALAQGFTDFVKDVRKQQGKTLSSANKKVLKAMVEPLTIEQLKMFEWILVLWPKFGHSSKMNKMIEIVTNAMRKSDKKESRRGQFSEKVGGEIKSRLSKAAKQTEYGQCLNFLANEGLRELYPGKDIKIHNAISRYAKVARERKKKGQAHGGGTLSIMASEMRLENLLGPINVLKWKGSANKGRHQTDPVELFNRFSSAGDGWYFFLASVVSYHTFIIAVHVNSGGTKRTYFEIQDGQSVRKTPAQLKAWFDKEFLPNDKLASSRVWQVYR